MPLEILTFVLGPLENNTYLLANSESGEAVVIDPSSGSQEVVEEARRRGYSIQAVWMTHAHFDHLTGLVEVVGAFDQPPPVALHPADLDLWNTGGGAWMFGVSVPRLPQPAIELQDGLLLQLGQSRVEVRDVPGHTPGHVLFYVPDACTAFVGDLIFYHGVGRTDLPGGSHEALLDSIRAQVFTLPPQTRLLPGHGPATTVTEEQASNLFL